MASMVNVIVIAAVAVMVIGFLFFGVFSAVIFGKTRKMLHRNDHAPRVSVPARVVAKRADFSHSHSHVNGHTARGMTTYYVTFELDNRERVELCVHGYEYGMLVEGDHGTLTFKGNAFLDFRRN